MATAPAIVRRDLGRVRIGAEVPPADDARIPVCGWPCEKRPTPWACSRRPSIGWRRVACTTSSEAASPGTRPTRRGWSRTSRRCCTTTPSSPSCTPAPGGHSRRALSADRNRDARVPGSRDAASGRRLLLESGRRLRRRRGEVLHLVVGRAHRAWWARKPRRPSVRLRAATGPGEHGEGTNVLRRPEAADLSKGDLEEARRDPVRGARSVACGPRRTTRCSPRGTRWPIQAFAEAGRAFGDERFHRRSRSTAAEFVLSNLRRPDGRLLRSWRDGMPGGPGYADDHALLASACSRCSPHGELRWFREAKQLVDDLVRLFADQERGGSSSRAPTTMRS